MTKSHKQLRVAFVVGTLGLGGAEKQLVYMARALHEHDVDVRIYTLTRGEFYEDRLQALGIPLHWVGRLANPVGRLAAITHQAWSDQPHILQSAHFYVNLYTALVGASLPAVTIGAIRNNTTHEMQANPGWGSWLLRSPQVLLTNSLAAKRNAEQLRIGGETIWTISNVIDLPVFDEQASQTSKAPISLDRPVVALVGRLVAAKRVDRFVRAVALARQDVPEIQGIVIGDGPERTQLELLANELGLLPDGLAFLGQRMDIPGLLAQAQMLTLSSDEEGFPNVLLEAMAAKLPVVTTPAGDAGIIVVDGQTGHVVPFDDIACMAQCIVHLVSTPSVRLQMGQAGRRRVEQLYSFKCLATNLLQTYQSIAISKQNRYVLDALSPLMGS